MPADRVQHPTLTEFAVGADHGRVMLRSPHRQLVVLGTRKASRASCPALMTTLPQHTAHRGIYIVIKQEPH
jgi:hypothetical protein